MTDDGNGLAASTVGSFNPDKESSCLACRGSGSISSGFNVGAAGLVESTVRSALPLFTH